MFHPSIFSQFLADEDGQTLVEYGLLISLVALVVIAVLTLLGKRLQNSFGRAANTISNATS